MPVSTLFNTQLWNTQLWNGEAKAHGIGIEHAILFITTTISLTWASVASATHYQVQVSLFSDFRTIFETAVVTASEHSFTDAQTNNVKRYWRWRPSTDGGSTYMEPFSEVGSYWLDTGAAQEIRLDRNEFMLADADNTADRYQFQLFPNYSIVDVNLFRIHQRNLLGELLSEFLTIKSEITMMFQGNQYISKQQHNEFIRFHNIARVCYLVAYKDGERARPMPHIWKVEFVDDPQFSMLAAGRPDLLQGEIKFTEV